MAVSLSGSPAGKPNALCVDSKNGTVLYIQRHTENTGGKFRILGGQNEAPIVQHPDALQDASSSSPCRVVLSPTEDALSWRAVLRTRCQDALSGRIVLRPTEELPSGRAVLKSPY